MTEGATAYPLAWPPGWPRMEPGLRERARFTAGRNPKDYNSGRGASMVRARRELSRELELLRASSVVLSTNVELRIDGEPYANRKAPEDPGAAVYFVREGVQLAIACDRFDRVADNVYAIARTVWSLRSLDRWGTSQLVRAAFSGFRALPAAGESSTDSSAWWTVLGFEPGAEVSRAEVDAAYRQKAAIHHPDKGGDVEAFTALGRARRQALDAIGAREASR